MFFFNPTNLDLILLTSLVSNAHTHTQPPWAGGVWRRFTVAAGGGSFGKIIPNITKRKPRLFKLQNPAYIIYTAATFVVACGGDGSDFIPAATTTGALERKENKSTRTRFTHTQHPHTHACLHEQPPEGGVRRRPWIPAEGVGFRSKRQK